MGEMSNVSYEGDFSIRVRELEYLNVAESIINNE
jgi:hypothetical protein